MTYTFASDPIVKNTFLQFDPSEFSSHASEARRPRSTPPAPCQDVELPVAQHPTAAKISFTLRRADGVQLGAELLANFDRSLSVRRVLRDGALDSWNRLCSSASRRVESGDRIVKINEACTPAAMRRECEEKLLLRICMVPGTKRKTPEAQQIQLAQILPAPCMYPFIHKAPDHLSWWSGIETGVSVHALSIPTEQSCSMERSITPRHSKLSDDESTVWGSPSPRASSYDTSSDADAEGSFTVKWSEDSYRFHGRVSCKKSRLTMMHTEGEERFCFGLAPASDDRGRLGAGVQCSLEIKCNSEQPSSRLRAVSIGGGKLLTIGHDFTCDGLMCRVSQKFDFACAIAQNANALSFEFYFDLARP